MSLIEPKRMIKKYLFEYKCNHCGNVDIEEVTGIEISRGDVEVECSKCNSINRLRRDEIGVIVSMLDGRE